MLLSHISSLRLSSEPLGPVLNPKHAGSVSLFSSRLLLAVTSVWAASLLELQLDALSVGFFFFPPGYVSLWDSKTPHRPTGERVSWCLETFPPSWPPPWDGSPALTLLSLFLSFIVCPTSFWREWTAFLVPGVLCQHSEVVLWNLLSVQMIFQWICGGESDFPILFLHHLRTTPHPPTKHFWNLSSLPMPDCESCLQVSEHHCTSFPFL